MAFFSCVCISFLVLHVIGFKINVINIILKICRKKLHKSCSPLLFWHRLSLAVLQHPFRKVLVPTC